MPSVQDGFLDPQCIAQTRFNYAKNWDWDGKELATGETIEEKEKIQNQEIKKVSLKVAACISLAFKNIQRSTSIWLPYNFE
jgi:hypothetical protein